MPDRFQFTEMFDRGWDLWDPELVKSALAEGFFFDDPALPERITRDGMENYVLSWKDRVRSLGGTGAITNQDVVRADVDGAFITWQWWRFEGTAIQGSAVVRTTDDGVAYERITYYPETPRFN